DENGCSEEITVEITEPDAITITENSSDYNGFGVSCNGASDGSIDISVDGGVGVYSYTWSSGQNSEDLNDIGAGTYNLTVIDENGCSEEITVEITESDAITITENSSDYNGFGVSCNGATDGFIDITAEGGVGLYTYSWSGGQTTEDLSNLAAGSYNLTVTDENGCSEEITVEITEPDAIEILFDSIDDLCFGACNGSIDVNLIGGTLSYSYNWTGPDSFSSSSQNIANLCPGTYSLLVTDSNNCSESIEVDINQEELINTLVDIIPPQCSGYTACVTLESFGGSGANYSYEFYIDNSNEGPQNNCSPEDEDILFDPEFSNGCFNLNSGSYYVTTTDENGCCVFNTFTIVAESEVSVDINEVPDCYPNESFLILSGWNPPLESYNILIFDNDTDNDGLDNILSNNIPLDDDINNINGPNSSDNDIDGDGILNDDDFIDLDGNGIFNFGDVNTQYLFSNPPLYDFVYDQQADIDCGDFLGGVWDGDGDGPGTCNEFPLVYDGGSTVVLIISESGCFNFQIVSNDNDIYLPIESTNEVTNSSCFGETNDIGDSDSDDLDGDNCLDDLCSGSITINISEPGNYVQPYTIYVTDSIFDANGVLIYESLNSDNDFFDENDSYPLLNIGDADDDNDGLLDYEDPFPFDSDNDGVDDCVGPNYDCDNDGILNDGDPDSDNDGILNEDDDLFGISDLIPDSLIYIFDSDNGLVSSDTDGDGDLDQLVINNLCPGQYLYVIQDANGCESIPLTFEVLEAEELIVSAESGGDPAILCNEEDSDNCYGFVDVTVTGGTSPYTYSWSNGDTTEDLTNLCAGTYELIVTDSNGCCEAIERTIEEIPEILISINEFNENIDCNGNCNGIIDIDISGGTEPYIFNWTGPNNFSSDQLFLDSLCAGTYFLQGFDSTIDVNGNNCSFFEEFIINEPEEISINFDVVGSCFNEENGAIDLTVTGGTGIYTYSWSNGDTNEDLNNLEPGIYIINVIDENSCTQSEEIQVIEFEELIITETHSDYNGYGVTCGGAVDGFIDITVEGGSGVYTYSWSNGQSSQDLENIGVGIYNVIVTDENDCTTEISVEIIEPDLLIITENSSNYNGFGVSCNGESDGFIDVSVEGGLGLYSYSWSNGDTTEDLSNLGAGTYTVTVTDENGCSEEITVEITEPDSITITENISNYNGFGVSCNGATDGFIDITVEGGVGLYSYTWSSGQTTEDLSNLDAGTYTVTVTDENGCSEEINIEITESDPLIITENTSNYNGFGVSCNGEFDGFIDVTVEGGSGFFDFSWSSGQVTEDISNIGAGTYTLTVTEGNGCEESITIEITEPDPLELTVNLIQNIQCNNCDGSEIDDSDLGRISIVVSGEVGPYFVEVFDSNGFTESFSTTGSDLFQTSNPGDYYFVVTGENDCEQDITSEIITISSPEPFCIENAVVQNSSCFSFEFNDGSIEIFVSGGTPPYNYDWSSNIAGPGFANSSFIDNLSAGVYGVVVTDNNGCLITSESYQIFEPSPITLDVCNDEFVCCGSNNGTIIGTAVGGDPGYLYTLFDSSIAPPSIIGSNNSGIFNGLIPGEYLLTVIDSSWSEDLSSIDPNACSASEIIIINESCPEIILVDEEIAGCSNEANLFFDIFGGVPPYSIYVDGIQVSTILTDTNNYSISIPSGTHDLYVVDSNIDISNSCETIIDGCISNEISVEVDIVEQPFEIEDIIITHPLCPGDFGSMTIIANGTEPPPGEVATFEFGVDTGDGVLQLFEVEAAYNSTVSTITDLGINYIFNIPYVSSGQYLYNAFDYYDCSISGSFSVNEVTELNFDNFFVSVDADCLGASGSAYVSTSDIQGGTPPFSISWFELDSFGNLIEDPNGNGNANALYAGDYVVQITDFNECVYEHSFVINEPEEQLLANLEVYDPVCYNENSCTGTVTSYATGGQGVNYSFTWLDSNENIILSGSQNNLNNLCEGEYSVIISDGICNPITQYFSINEPEEISIEINSELLCYGDLVVLPDNPNVPDVVVNTTISSNTQPVTVYWFDNYVTNSTTPILIEDNFGNISLNINALDIDDDGQLNILDPDTDNDGLNNNNDIDPLGYGNGNWWPYLSSNALDISISDNGFSLSTINSLYAGSYYLYIIDENGCFSEMIYNIDQPDELIVNWNESDLDTFIECNGEENGSLGVIIEGGTPVDDDNWPFPYYYATWLNLDNSSSATFSFDNQEISIDTLGPGTYIVEVQDANGCTTQTDEIIITEADVLEITDFSVSEFNGFNISCNGTNDGEINVSVSGGISPYIFNWTGPNNFTSNNQNIQNLEPGTYSLTVQSNIPDGSLGDGCVEYLEIEITEPEQLSIIETHSDYNGYGVSCNDEISNIGPINNGFINIDVIGGVPPYTYQWSGDSVEQTQDLSNILAGTYTLTVTDENGCFEEITVQITEPDPEITFDQFNGLDVFPASCKEGNNSDASISLNIDFISGGVPPYNIILVETNDQYNNVNAGEIVNFNNLNWDLNNDGIVNDIYNIIIEDSNGCQILIETDPINFQTGIFQLDPPLLDEILPSCSSNNDGSLMLGAIDGGTPPYQLSWTSDNGFTANYTWEDGGGNIDGDLLYNYIDSDIDGDNLLNENDQDIDGDGILNINDPVPYGPGTELAGILSPGDYFLTIVDANGCVSTYNFNLGVVQPQFNAYLSEYNGGFNVSCGYNEDNCDNLEENAILTIDEIEFNNPTPPIFYYIPVWPQYQAYPISILLDGVNVGLINSQNDIPFQIPNIEPNIVGGELLSDSYELQLIDNNSCLIQSINLNDISQQGLFDILAPEPLDISLSVGNCPECQDAENGSIEIVFSGGVGIQGGYNFYLDQDGNDDIVYYDDLDGDCILNYIPGTTHPLDNDIDGDGVLNFNPDIDGDGILNFNLDIDNDGIENYLDDDIDGDGLLNSSDVEPLGPNSFDIDIDDDGDLDFSVVFQDDDIDGDGIDNLQEYAQGADSNIFTNSINGFTEFDQSPFGSITVESTDGSWVIENLPFGEYLVGVSDSNGCVSESSINISNEFCQFEVYDWINCLFIPSVFTPNMDGVNDYWEIYNIELYEPAIILKVYNRWGQIVFEREGEYSSVLWDGNSENGKQLEIGTYYYTLEIKEYNKNYNGHVVIKR
ncbi:MAG: hypothetical protein CMP68_04860, partial [Flavobacteriales bacterium]|nr:hypothetical protein [Flavobacteriales bacterium]